MVIQACKVECDGIHGGLDISELREILETVPHAIRIKDSNNNTLAYNKELCHLLNKGHKDIIGNACYEIIGKDEPCDFCATFIAYKTKKAAHIEKYVEFLDKWIDFRSYPIFDDDGKLIKVVEHMRDVTREKKLEGRLYRAIEQDENSGKGIAEIKPDIDLSNEKNNYYSKVSESSLNGFALHKIVTDEQGNPIDYIFLNVNSVFEEMTGAFKIKEELLLQKKMSVEAASMTQNEFFASINHELRTPLVSILEFTELLLSANSKNLTTVQKRYLENIHSSGTHLVNLTNSILYNSKIKAGKIEPDYENIDIKSVVTEVQNVMYPLATKKNIDLRVSELPENVEFEADRIKVKQILCNLLGNAVKFTPANGTIDLNVTNDNSSVTFSITDTGSGMDEACIKNLFNPFVRLNSENICRCKGTGLGLMISKEFIDMHGGIIAVKSKKGKGSTFSFSIPVKKVL